MTVANQIIIKAKQGEEKNLKNELNLLVAQALLEKGCQKFELYQLLDAKDEFFIVEIWKSERSYNKHLENERYLQHRDILKHLIDNEKVQPLKLTQCLTELGLKAKQEKK